MRIILYMLLCLGGLQAGILYGQTYDSTLAKSLGGDAQGMKKYFLVILKTGPAQITDKTVRDSLFQGHMATIEKLADAGKLIVAGPLEKNALAYRGIFIFNVATIQEVEGLLKEDPSIHAGIFETEILVWYGSAALPTYLVNHAKIVK